MLPARMRPPDPEIAHAFRALSHRLAARRFAGLGPRLTLVTLVLVLSVSAFTYWRVRVPLDGVVHHRSSKVQVRQDGGLQRARQARDAGTHHRRPRQWLQPERLCEAA